ncbi:MAG: dihydrofolate reductase, partial [Actinobacteria bacterium]
MQAPGRADEDLRGGFRHGGWAVPHNDLGRRSYEQMLGSWNARGGPYKDALNNAPKHVVSSNPATKLDWPNSTLVHGDVPAVVAELKQGSTGDLVIIGSGQLIRSLLPHELIDEYLLLIYPLVLGSGQRLFEPDDHLTNLRLVESTPTTKGVILATYEPI